MQQPPQNRKYKKCQKMRIRQLSYSKGGTYFLLGSSALKALKAKRLVPKQVEAARRVITRKFKKKAKV
jgi:ribosomal protein L16/L10AE